MSREPWPRAVASVVSRGGGPWIVGRDGDDDDDDDGDDDCEHRAYAG